MKARIGIKHVAMLLLVAVASAAAVAGNPTANRVSRTFARMARSTVENPETVRILFYGQSIVAQDWGRKFIIPELKKRYPTVNFVVENRALGGYEAPTLIKTAEADLYPFYPDLLFFHVYGDTDKYIEIVRRVRERTAADVILWTSHLNAREGETKEKIEDLIARPDTRSMVIRGAADRYGCMFVDLRTKWCRMLLDAGKISKDMLVDSVHMKAESLPIYANMLTEDLPFGCAETANEFAGTVQERPASLRLAFTGNRVVAVSDGRKGADYDVFLDGKPVEEHGEMWTFTRTTPGVRNTNWPMLSFVSRTKPSCAREKWTLELIEGFNAEGTVLPYKLTGSLTGPDGVGCNTNRFVSNSGKVEILPSAWPGFTGRWGRWNYLKTKPEVGLKVEWENVPMFVAPYRPGARHEETVLVQGCANGPHVLELKPRTPGPLGIMKFRTYAPAGGRAAEPQASAGAEKKKIVGYMLDISRFRVPTMETVKRQVDILADLGYNHFQLYTEHTFAYPGHEDVWREASPFTPAEIRELDAYCADRGIELVPNQNSFGHLEHWLKHPAYNHLAEAPQGGTKHGGWVCSKPASLCPTDPESVTFVAGLYDALFPCFRSKFVNVGGDETMELLDDSEVRVGRSAAAIREKGAHRVYVEFLNKLHALVAERGHEMMFWGDIVLQKPEFVKDLPKDLIALDWGYEANHPFAKETATLREAGLRFIVCPGSSTWCTLLGRTDVMMANIDNAIENGEKNGAMGAMLTDWEQYPQPWSCSLPAIVYFAHRVRGEKLTEAELAAKVDSIVGCRAGASLLALGKVYQKVSPLKGGIIYSTSLRHLLALGEDYPWGKNKTTRETFRAALEAWKEARALADLEGGTWWIKEDFATIDLVEKAVRMRVEEPHKKNFTAIIEPEYRRLWLRQSRPGGLSGVISRLFHSR